MIHCCKGFASGRVGHGARALACNASGPAESEPPAQSHRRGLRTWLAVTVTSSVMHWPQLEN